jgi:hypothetical protein
VTTDSQHAKREIVRLAKEIEAGRIDTLEGVREVVRLRAALSVDDVGDADLVTLVGFESELDDVPSQRVRPLWAPEAFAEKHREKDEYLARVRHHVVDACRMLAAKWGGS